MPQSRREFLRDLAVTSGAIALSGRCEPAEPPPRELRAAVEKQQMHGAAATDVWAFNGRVPGPELRYRRGDRLVVQAVNALDAILTVHWHGLRLPHAMDGVPYLTQPPIQTGGRFTYQFQLSDSGTFWYHPHTHSFEQVARGLYGALIVEELAPPPADRDVVWVLSDMRLDHQGRQAADFGATQEFSTEGRIGNTVLVNGRPAGGIPHLEIRSGERVRLRLINAATARLFRLAFPQDHLPTVIALDGHGIVPHVPENGLVSLAPGERVDLMIDCVARPGSRFQVMDRWRTPFLLAEIAYSDESPARAERLAPTAALAPNDIPAPDLRKAVRHEIVFRGGAAGPPVIGLVDGKPVSTQAMIHSHKLAWTLNSVAAREDALRHDPLLRLKLGGHYRIGMTNETGFVHPMHLHGYTFLVTSINGKPPQHRQWRDTVTLAPFETVEIALVADNPGEWMFHCHILEHAASGMMGTISVE